MSKWDEINAKEASAFGSYCEGNGIDVACGSRVYGNAVGVDIKARGEITEPWGVKSSAHLAFDCSDLPFKDNVLDYVVGVHAIEHFVDTLGTLNEWLRVLKPTGYLCLIVPDRTYTPKMGSPTYDITHKIEFTPEEFSTVLEGLENVEIVQYNTMDNQWSFDCILKKV